MEEKRNAMVLSRSATDGRDLAAIERVCDKLAKARGFIPDVYIDKPGAILAAVLTGRALGLDEMTSLRLIHVIEGRATLSAESMLILARRSGVRHRWIESTAARATIALAIPGEGTRTLTMTRAELDAVGVTQGKNGPKDNWRKHPEAMLRARVQSSAIRAYCPEVLAGGLYASEEIGDGVIDAMPLHSEEEQQIEALLVGQPDSLVASVRASVMHAMGDVAELNRIEAKLRAVVKPHETVEAAAASAAEGSAS